MLGSEAPELVKEVGIGGGVMPPMTTPSTSGRSSSSVPRFALRPNMGAVLDPDAFCPNLADVDNRGGGVWDMIGGPGTDRSNRLLFE